MAETIEPFDGGPYMLESGWSTMFSMAMTNGVSSRASNGLRVYTDNDGRRIKIAAGTAHIRGHLYRSTDIIIRDLTPNTSGNPRIDRVVLRLDTLGKSATPFVIEGAPAVSPAVPAMIQIIGGIWDIPLADIAVVNGFTSIVTGNITDQRTYVGAMTAGNILDGFVQTGESTTSNTATDLPTVGPVVTIDIPPSGIAMVSLSASMYSEGGGYSVMSFAVSGANTIGAAAANRQLAFGNANGASNANPQFGTQFLLTGLNPGRTTFTVKYAHAFATFALFSNRRLIVQVFP